MSKFKSDIEIARKAKMYPINKVLKKFKYLINRLRSAQWVAM